MMALYAWRECYDICFTPGGRVSILSLMSAAAQMNHAWCVIKQEIRLSLGQRAVAQGGGRACHFV